MIASLHSASPKPLRALAVGRQLPGILRAAGVEVTQLNIEPGIVHLPGLLHKRSLNPAHFDFFAQQEDLGPRLFLEGVHTLPCPTVFWSVDTHLNLYWQRYYGRLFDCVFTPHLSLIDALPELWRLPAERLAMPGERRPFVPHSDRAHPLSFVGVLTRYRPLRSALIELLRERNGLVQREGLSHADMMDLYSQTRCIPNESIAFEVNFRLLEGASCGACVLNPDVGEDQDALFARDTEMRVYEDGLDLLEQIDMFLTRPQLAEKIGRAAWERVQAEHLPAARGAQFLAKLPDVRNRATGTAADSAFVLTLLQLFRNKRLPEEYAVFLNRLVTLPESEESLAARLRLAAERGDFEQVDEINRRLLLSGDCADSFTVNMAAASVALFRKDLDAAKQFWYRQKRPGNGVRPPQKPESVAHACVLWADAARKEGFAAQPGFAFEPKEHCPETAFEFLFLAQHREPKNARWLDSADHLTAEHKGLTFYRVGILARLALDRPEDWRMQTRYGLACLLAYRVEAGLHELNQARRIALAQGQERHFFRMLDGSSANGHLTRALERLTV